MLNYYHKHFTLLFFAFIFNSRFQKSFEYLCSKPEHTSVAEKEKTHVNMVSPDENPIFLLNPKNTTSLTLSSDFTTTAIKQDRELKSSMMTEILDENSSYES